MTASTEASARASRRGRPCDAQWRATAAQAQLAAMPAGEVAVSCSAPLGSGGLGRHLSEILDALARGGRTSTYTSGCTRAADSSGARGAPRHALGIPYVADVIAPLPLPFSPGVRTRAFMSEFDAYAAARLPAAQHLIAFNGQALTQFRAARRAGYESLELVSANSHLRQVSRQHARAHARYPLEGSWTKHLLARNLAEYRQADRIHVSSQYVWDSFLEQGFRAEQLVRFPLTPHPRFTRASERESSAEFEIVYVGSLAVHKGVPLLIDAVRRLPHADLRLVLVGGWGTRGMRRFVQGACASDSRISVSPGDPLERLRRARLCVHPTYEDGFAYAPAEALACGVPVIVSQDTGMKELIDSPDRGLIVPTGDLDALREAIDAAYRGELFGG